MPAVYIDDAGDVRSRASGRVIAPAGTSARTARMYAALWAAAADALTAATAEAAPAGAEGMSAVAAPTPISAAPSYAVTVQDTREVLAVVDVERLFKETEQALAELTIWKEPS